MKKLFFLLTLFSFILSFNAIASDQTADNCSAYAIQTAIDDCILTGGGTVAIPACDFTNSWQASDKIYKNVGATELRVIGQGTSKTKIGYADDQKMAGSMWEFKGEGFKEFAHIYLEGNPIIETYRIDTALFIRDAKDSRIHNMETKNFRSTAGILCNTDNLLIDSSTFGDILYKGKYQFYVYGKADEQWSDDWPENFGTANYNVFFEDNTIGGAHHPVSLFDKARVVFRENEVLIPPGYQGNLDSHSPGYDSCSGDGISDEESYEHGGQAYEIYNNTFTRTDITPSDLRGVAIRLRSGSAIIYNNTFEDCKNGISLVLEDHNIGGRCSFEDGFPQDHSFGPGTKGCTDSDGCCDKIENIYIWENDFDNVDIEFKTEDAIDGLTKNVDYFLRAPNQTADGFDWTPYPYPHPLRADDENFIHADSCSADDIQTAADAIEALEGGIVYIPAEECTHTKIIKISDGVSLIGAGQGQTIIYNANIKISTRFYGFLDKSFRISGMSLLGDSHLSIDRASGFRIDNITIETAGGSAIGISRSHSAVIDHCTISVTKGYYGISINGNPDHVFPDDWVFDTSELLGQSTAIFIENCDFYGANHGTVGHANAHYVLRYNTFTDNYGSWRVDAHGPGYTNPPDGLGTRLVEVYENVFNYSTHGHNKRAIGIRGGSAVIFNNTINDLENGIMLTLESRAHLYPEEERVHDVWIWNNDFEPLDAPCTCDWESGVDGCCEVMVWDVNENPVLGDSKDYIREGYEYFLREPSLEQDGFDYTHYLYPHPLTDEDCTDIDEDGYCSGHDCDDSDADKNPGAFEDCFDEIDNDCDGKIDGEDSDCTLCWDNDEDGYEDEFCGGDDCDDLDISTYPGAIEICGDGIDQDCVGGDLECEDVEEPNPDPGDDNPDSDDDNDETDDNTGTDVSESKIDSGGCGVIEKENSKGIFSLVLILILVGGMFVRRKKFFRNCHSDRVSSCERAEESLSFII